MRLYAKTAGLQELAVIKMSRRVARICFPGRCRCGINDCQTDWFQAPFFAEAIVRVNATRPSSAHGAALPFGRDGLIDRDIGILLAMAEQFASARL